MRIKKTAALILAMILVVTMLPGTVFAATNFTPQYASGYYPSGVNNPQKQYNCSFWGSTESVTAQMSYGSGTYVLGIVNTTMYGSPSLGIITPESTTSNGTYDVSLSVSVPYYIRVANGYIAFSLAIYKVGASQVEQLMLL